MNIVDQLRVLDPRDPGRWPLAVRGFFVALIFAVFAGLAWYLLVWNDDRPVLQKAEADELDLRSQFENKQQRAANLDAYKAQLAEMERSFGAMLRQLPGKTEVPNLLVDISQTGLSAGLQEKLFQPGAEKSNGFYAELPIRIKLVGTYHQFGAFVSGIALLTNARAYSLTGLRLAGYAGLAALPIAGLNVTYNAFQIMLAPALLTFLGLSVFRREIRLLSALRFSAVVALFAVALTNVNLQAVKSSVAFALTFSGGHLRGSRPAHRR